jgi:AraC-like DNA-binding protein
MLAEALDAAEASFRVGYESPSQFSREYRRLFGEPPRRDIELLRGRATAGTPLPAGVSARKSPTRRPDPGLHLGALAEY